MEMYSLASGDAATIAGAVAERLGRGEVGIVPTETVYGIVCQQGNDSGVERIFRMKVRDPQKKLQVLIADQAAVAAVVTPTTMLSALAAAFWPGPLTIVVEDSHGMTHGLRQPDHAFVAAVLRELGTPLVTTSANISGSPPATEAATAMSELAAAPDFVVDGGPCCGRASTVVRLHGDGRLEVVRDGDISTEQLTAVAH
ncbi:MAG: L-threonylcarbamoyladenylate synthase [Lentisphaeria bacterium]|jgi:L-threonylcarbamoyladenylate synthase|nr:L-threonylcarbamoyladenylate synthase [Lentisphaeria bacterium]